MSKAAPAHWTTEQKSARQVRRRGWILGIACIAVAGLALLPLTDRSPRLEEVFKAGSAVVVAAPSQPSAAPETAPTLMADPTPEARPEVRPRIVVTAARPPATALPVPTEPEPAAGEIITTPPPEVAAVPPKRQAGRSRSANRKSPTIHAAVRPPAFTAKTLGNDR